MLTRSKIFALPIGRRYYYIFSFEKKNSELAAIIFIKMSITATDSFAYTRITLDLGLVNEP